MKRYRTGKGHCFADACLFTVTRWTVRGGVETSTLKGLGLFVNRKLARPLAQATMKTQGLNRET